MRPIDIFIFCLLLAVASTVPVHNAVCGPEEIPDTAVVARIGSYVITADNLMESYEVAPAFVRTMDEPLRSLLRYLVYEYLMASEAERVGLDTASFTDRMIRAIEEDLTVDQLYHDDVLSLVQLSEENINAGVQKGRVMLRLRWLFTESLSEAEGMYRAYREGIPFDSLFRRNLPPETSPQSRMFEGTQLHLERDNPGLMKKIVHLRTQEVSEPVEGPDGFYIFRVDEIWQNPILPEHEYTLLREQATSVLTKVRADEISETYIQELFDEERPEIIPAGMYVIRAYLAEKGLSEERREEFEIPLTVMTEGGPQTIIGNPELLSMPVARTSAFTVTAQDYLDWFEIRQIQIKRHSRDAFNASILGTVRKMVQDKMLSERAYGRGLHERPVVRRELNRWKGKILYSVFRREFQRSIRSSEEEPRSRYPGEENVLLHRLLRDLHARYEVWIDDELLNRLAGGIEEEGAPVNVIFYKPGGTFPRVAYPTIDRSWFYYDN